MSLIVNNEATPVTPSSGTTEVFVNSSKRLSSVDDAAAVKSYVDESSSEVISNKKLDSTCTLVDATDNTKVVAENLSSIGAGITLTEVYNQSTSQSLNYPNITATDTLVVTTLAQAVSNKTLSLKAGTTSVAPEVFASGTNLTSPAAGAVEFDGTSFYDTIDTTSGRAERGDFQIFRLNADGGAIGPGIADFFGANSAFPTVLNAIYLMEFIVWFTKTTAGTVTWTLTNTQAYTNIAAYYDMCPVGGIGTNGAQNGGGIDNTTTAAAALPVTGTLTTATEQFARIIAVVNVGTAGNIRLRVTSSAGTVTPRRGSYYRVQRLFAGNVGTFVA